MNQKFYQLPEEKQQRIISAGFKAFGDCPYKKASMSYIADEAQISKPLLFHYFINKKELYLFLFKKASAYNINKEAEDKPAPGTDFFDYLRLKVTQTLSLGQSDPYIFRFLRRSFYETDPEVAKDIDKEKTQYLENNNRNLLAEIDLSHFKNFEDAPMLLEMITLMCEGYMSGQAAYQTESLETITEKFAAILSSLKKNYYR